MIGLLRGLLDNHVLANLVFALVLLLGTMSYLQMPRAKDPQLNLRWINIVTIFPGASAEDIERRVTDPFEEAIQRSVRDVKFVSSTSREGNSNIIVRFEDIDERTYDKRISDLRREIQNTYTDEMPEEVEDPYIVEITSSNWFPTATIAVYGSGDDENLRRRARDVKRDLENLDGVDDVNALGLRDPEIHIAFHPERLSGTGIGPEDIADTVRGYFRDISAGDIETREGQWLVRIAGTDPDPGRLAELPILTANGVVQLGSLADLSFATDEPRELVRFRGRPAALMYVTKDSDANVLDLIGRLNDYIADRNALGAGTGVDLFLVDDQTVSTRNALALMQTNALIGLFFVLVVTWVFLGTRISLLTSIGIPFTLAGTFIALNAAGMTINNTVLLGVVISLGMLVDDAVVVVESIYQRLLNGEARLAAAVGGLAEVAAPVTTSVLTTMAAFLPLALLPGILGEFMRVIPIVVSVALAISLLEAYWMLPAHMVAAGMGRGRERSRSQRLRERFTHWIRLRYTRILLRALRRPIVTLTAVSATFAVAVVTVASGIIPVNFFAGDTERIFYVGVEMPPGTPLAETARTLAAIEAKTLEQIDPDELRGSVIYAGQQFGPTDTLFGDVVGQVQVSLKPARTGSRPVLDIADDVEAQVLNFPGTRSVNVLRIKDGPPTARPVSVKVRGSDFEEILAAVEFLRGFLERNPEFKNISADYRPGNPELVLRYDGDAIKRAGVDPSLVSRAVMLHVDGELVSDFQYAGEEVRVRVKSSRGSGGDIENLLREVVPLSDGRSIPLGELVTADYALSQYNIRHYDFRRAITLEADIDTEISDTVAANARILEAWDEARARFPNINLDFTGELDDIAEAQGALTMLFALGVGLMYIILGTQFRSYFQPLMILMTVPLAFTGVVLGLLCTGNPLSLYTLYGTVALAGIAVNSAIVLISTANSKLHQGMGLMHATVYSARRRVVPILITSATTIAGLFSLAAGLAGKSFIWGPVATAIVWGLAFSSALTLIVIPMLYRMFMPFSYRVRGRQQHP